MKTSKPISSQFQTWITNLAEFNFDVEFRKGAAHGNADGLSRIGESLCSQCQTSHQDGPEERSRVKRINVLNKTNFNKCHIKEIQKKVPITSETIEYLKKGNRSSKLSPMLTKSKYFLKLEKFELNDGLLIINEDNRKKIVLAGKSIPY